MNTLFLGNGFSMSVAPEIPAWKSLLKSETSKIKNYPILYEQNFIQNADKTEESIKKDISKGNINLRKIVILDKRVFKKNVKIKN